MSVMSFENIQTSKVIQVFLISQAAFDVKTFVFVKCVNNIILFLTDRENKLTENLELLKVAVKVTIVCKFYFYFISIVLVFVLF